MYLMNAVYFKGLWTEPFNASNNRVATFSPERSTDVNLTYMCMDARQFAYTQDSQVQIAEFPYGNGAFSMLIVLPKSGIAIDDILTDLNTQKWSDWTRALTETILNVQIPKFTFNYELNLNRILSDMGMSIAFDANRANFSRINPADRLFLTEVKQKAYVSVDEKGTEAAAVTSIGVGVTSMPIATSFIANHSFLFFIREKSTGIILFAGKYGG
jgi:serpin B